MVTRKEKLFVLSSALPAIKLSNFPKLIVVGCSIENLKAAGIDHTLFQPVGYIPQSEIYLKFGNLISFPGYGEGIPHSVVDALCSGMSVHLSRKDYVSFGLHRLGLTKSHSFPGFVCVKGVIDRLFCSNINHEYQSFFGL